jgi:hypothetical protein
MPSDAARKRALLLVRELDNASMARGVAAIPPAHTITCTGGKLTLTGLNQGTWVLSTSYVHPLVLVANARMFLGKKGLYFLKSAGKELSSGTISIKFQRMVNFYCESPKGVIRKGRDSLSCCQGALYESSGSMAILGHEGVPDDMVVLVGMTWMMLNSGELSIDWGNAGMVRVTNA